MKRLAVLCIVLAGCATTEKFNALMDSWIGKPESRLVGRLGPPTSSYALQDGSRVLQYTKGRTAQIGGNTVMQPITTNSSATAYNNRGGSATAYGSSTSYVPVQQPTYTLNYSCTVNFTVDSTGTVRAWNAQGNDCVAK